MTNGLGSAWSNLIIFFATFVTTALCQARVISRFSTKDIGLLYHSHLNPEPWFFATFWGFTYLTYLAQLVLQFKDPTVVANIGPHFFWTYLFNIFWIVPFCQGGGFMMWLSTIPLVGYLVSVFNFYKANHTAYRGLDGTWPSLLHYWAIGICVSFHLGWVIGAFPRQVLANLVAGGQLDAAATAVPSVVCIIALVVVYLVIAQKFYDPVFSLGLVWMLQGLLNPATYPSEVIFIARAACLPLLVHSVYLMYKSRLPLERKQS